MDSLPTRKSSAESIFYFIFFGTILLALAFYILKHFRKVFVLGFNTLDSYLMEQTNSLDKEPFAVSVPNTPRLFVLNTSLGSAISFKPSTDKSIKGYLCVIKNTNNINAPVQIKTITNVKDRIDNKGFIVIDLNELNDTATFSIVLFPITEKGKGMPSNMVYAYKQDDDIETKYLTTTPFDDNLDNYNFSTNITKNIYHK